MAHMGLPHMGVYSGGGVLFIGASCTPPMAPSGANSIWILIPPHRGIISANPQPLALWGVTILANKNRRTQCGPFAFDPYQ